MEATAYQQIRDSLRRHPDLPRVLVSNRFDEAGDATFLLRRMAGRQVQLPGNRDYWPEMTHLAWHRQQHQIENTDECRVAL